MMRHRATFSRQACWTFKSCMPAHRRQTGRQGSVAERLKHVQQSKGGVWAGGSSMGSVRGRWVVAPAFDIVVRVRVYLTAVSREGERKMRTNTGSRRRSIWIAHHWPARGSLPLRTRQRRLATGAQRRGIPKGQCEVSRSSRLVDGWARTGEYTARRCHWHGEAVHAVRLAMGHRESMSMGYVVSCDYQPQLSERAA